MQPNSTSAPDRDREVVNQLLAMSDLPEPRNDVVALYPEDPDKGEGIILSPDAQKEDLLTGFVIAAGPGKMIDGYLTPLNLNPGDRIAYRGRGRTEMKFKDHVLTLINEPWIFAVLERGHVVSENSGDSAQAVENDTMSDLGEDSGEDTEDPFDPGDRR